MVVEDGSSALLEDQTACPDALETVTRVCIVLVGYALHVRCAGLLDVIFLLLTASSKKNSNRARHRRNLILCDQF